MSRLLTVGLVVTIVVLAFNYYTEIARNTETSRQLNRVRLELHEGASGRSEALKKWELCRTDVMAARNIGKRLDGEVKRKDLMISDLTKQIKESRKRENKLKEEIESLNTRLSTADAKAKVYDLVCCDVFLDLIFE